MDLESLTRLFTTTLSPDPNVRKAGELQIRQIAGQEGVVAALLQIVSTEGVDNATRQACAVWLKNRVHTCYDIDPSEVRADRTPIPQSDRDALKSSLLRLLATTTSRPISIQLAATLKDVIIRDFPEKWPSLFPEINKLLVSGDVREVVAGCQASLELVKAFEARRKVLPELLPQLLPILVNIAAQSLSSPPAGTSQEIPMLLHNILKAYMKTTLIQLSPHQMSNESLVPWGRLFFQVINLQIPKDAVPADEDERERCEWWKAKKWSYATLGRLYRRYGDPSQLPSTLKEEYGAFAESFVNAFAPEIIKVFLHQIELYVSGQAWLSKKCQYHIFSFFSDCIKPKSTWHLIKPHFETLVSSFVYPQMSFNNTKEELWHSDPVDLVRQQVDDGDYFDTPLVAATTFLVQLVKSRTKATFMPILTFINNVLRSNPEAPQKYGALSMTVTLAPFIMRHPEVRDSMEQFLVQHVLPCFGAPEPYLRAVACESVNAFEKVGVKWSNEQNTLHHFNAVAAAMSDDELPVKIHAILALTQMIVVHESVRNTVAPQIGKLVQDLLKLCDETELESLNSSLKAIVAYYQTELLPVAVDLAIRLCNTYLRLASEVASKSGETVDPDLINPYEFDGGEDKEIAAMNTAQTIGTVISAVETSPEILAQVQDVITPIVVFTLEKQLIDLFDNVYELIDSTTFKLRTISPSLWKIFELTYQALKTHAINWIEEMIPTLDNFLSYGSDVFKSRADYKNMIVDIYTTVLTSDSLGENDFINGSKLADSILLNLRGHVDDYLQIIINATLAHFDSAKTNRFRLANLEVLINCVLYNPVAGLHFIEAYRPGMASVFLDRWFAAIKAENGLPRVYDKRLTIIALSALMEMEQSTIPESLKEGWKFMVSGALKVFEGLPKAVAARKELEETFEDDDDFEDDDEDYLNFNEDEGDVWDEESAYMEVLAKEGARLRAMNEKREGGLAASDSSSEEEEIEEELGYFSPLDAVNPYETFKHALTNLQIKNPAAYQAATTSLDVDQQTALIEVMKKADQPQVQAGSEAVVNRLGS